MKYYNFTYVGSCHNGYSSCFDQMPTTINCNESETRECFKELRMMIKRNFNSALRGNAISYKNYKMGLSITQIDTEKDRARIRRVFINPLNLK